MEDASLIPTGSWDDAYGFFTSPISLPHRLMGHDNVADNQHTLYVAVAQRKARVQRYSMLMISMG